MTAARPVRILLVDDSFDDQLLTRKALGQAKVANAVTTAETGEGALEHLRAGAAAGGQRTDLVLLDLNLPGMDGHEVLREIKRDDELCDVPVVMLTTSGDERDVRTAYREHVNAYVTKPAAYKDFAASIRCVEDFWLTTVHLPGHG